jgi:hypothetical protein
VDIEQKISFPSEQQTQNYLNYFTRAHSWYKHLSWSECTDFYFFLNPDVAKETIITQKASFLTKEKTELVTTENTIRYLEQYGNWFFCTEEYNQTYSHLNGPSFKIGLTAFIGYGFNDPSRPDYYAKHLIQRKKLEAHLFKIIIK